MRKSQTWPQGSVRRVTLDSAVLADNPWGDPVRRLLDIYVPAGYREDSPPPLFVYLAGFTQSGLSQTNWSAFCENMPERLDRLIGQGRMGPVVVVFPDCFTRFGGNQYLNSAGVGRYEDYVIDEVVPFAEAQLCCGGRGRRAVIGKSYGGFGALMQAMRRPGVWSAVACHSGYMGFEQCYANDLLVAATQLRRQGGTIEAFLSHFDATDPPSNNDVVTIAILAVAASYDSDPNCPSRIRLPIDLNTGEIILERWAVWQRHDPLRVVREHAAALRDLKALFIDCGDADEYHLQFGARRLKHLLDEAGVAHLYEEFAGGHEGIDHRLDESLVFLERALAEPALTSIKSGHSRN
jgi:enterochelin esterase-like enzyme